MKIDKLNVGQICSVRSIINHRNKDYIYRKYKKRFILPDIKEGYYDTYVLGDYVFTPKEKLEATRIYFLKDEKVYYKPHLEITMSNGYAHDKYFETEQELFDFMESEPMKGVNWINRN